MHPNFTFSLEVAKMDRIKNEHISDFENETWVTVPLQEYFLT